MHAGIARDVRSAEVAPRQPLMEAGLDSLAAVELRNAVAARFGTALPATVALDHPTLEVFSCCQVFFVNQRLVISEQLLIASSIFGYSICQSYMRWPRL